MDQTKQQIKTALETLPSKLQEFILSNEWWTRSSTVISEYALTEEQTGKIGDEILLTLLGLTDPDDLSVSFQTVAELPTEKADELALELETAVFTPISEELTELDPISIDDYRDGLPEVNEALAKLPKALQEIILSTETADKIQAIGQKYQLHIDQMGVLDEEINNVLFGVSSPTKLPEKIRGRLGLDQPTTDAIAREVNEQIFLKIRESLQALPEANEAVEAAKEANYGVETIPGAPENLPVELPNREEIIDGIEHPRATKEDTVFEQKMGKLFRIPREEVDLDPYLEKPENK